MVIEYEFAFEDGTREVFRVDTARPAQTGEGEELPAWTALEYHRCTNCPLAATEGARCPPAVDTAHIFERFKALFSYERTTVTVRTPERDYVKDCDVQTALHSLLGLIMASSGCPILRQLRAMAEHHLPFATPRETLYRTVSNHLLKQHFARRAGAPVEEDFASLHQLYGDLQTVNGCFVKRITAAAERDANLNALVLLFTVSALVQASLEEGLDELEELYAQD